MKVELSKLLRYTGYPLCFVIGFLISNSSFYQYLSLVIYPSPLQILSSPTGDHKAVLAKKHNLGDINFTVTVYGQQVYRSPDYMGYPDGFYREMLQWDESGRVIVLELLGKRVFAYDVITNRPLQKGDIKTYQFKADQRIHTNYAEIKDIDEE